MSRHIDAKPKRNTWLRRNVFGLKDFVFFKRSPVGIRNVYRESFVYN